MTARELYEYTLVELNKNEAPSFLLEDFVYFGNKAVQQYTNKIYNKYDINQQTTDDLRALKVTTKLLVYNDNEIRLPLEDHHWFGILPDNYWHLLNCIVVFEKSNTYQKQSKCDNIDEVKKVAKLARKVTSDEYPDILKNAYFKPSYKNPYFCITKIDSVVDKEESLLDKILDPCGDGGIILAEDRIKNVLDPCGEINCTIPKLKLDIRCGSTKQYSPAEIIIDYLKTPERINLTYEELESEEDTSQILEFPEYVCYEIVNELIKLFLENTENPRLQTNIPINQTIGVQQQVQQ